MDIFTAALLIALLLAVLASGLWIGLSLLAVALVGMELFTNRPVGDSMMLTIWGSTSSWTLTALPLFLWMGEILFRSKLSSDMFKGLAPWLERLPGRLLHVNVVGCTIFAAISGSSAATCAILVFKPWPISVPPWLTLMLPSLKTFTSAPPWLSMVAVKLMPNFSGVSARPRLRVRLLALNRLTASRRWR